MTLEQLKTKQQLINIQLAELLKRDTQLIDYIVGTNITIKKSDDEQEPIPQIGLIDQFDCEQTLSLNLIEGLYSNQSRLFNAIYSPEEAN